jgi:hypothetical protein
MNKPRGASPRRDYVLTRMVLLYEYNLVLYFMVRNGTSKKGGNAPRATDEKRFLSSASLVVHDFMTRSAPRGGPMRVQEFCFFKILIQYDSYYNIVLTSLWAPHARSSVTMF